MDSKINFLFASNLDSWHLITKNLDGGDTCSRHFTALYCLPHTPDEADHALNLLQVNGIPRRHPDESKWYHRTNTTSRDQLIPYLCFVARPKASVRPHFVELVAQHRKRLFMFTWNTKRNFRYPTLEEHQIKSTPDVKWDYEDKTPDFCGPNVWAVYLRGFLQHNLLPKILNAPAHILLHVLDLHKFVDCLIALTQHYVLRKQFGPTSKPGTIDHDCQNSTLVMHYAAHNRPTIISKLTWMLYRPMAQKAARSFFQQAEEPRLDIAIEQLN